MDETPAKVVKKRIRKPRGRGLRARTGCLTCRTRHRKCDETKPRCGQCTMSDRECIFATPDSRPETTTSSASSAARIHNIISPTQSSRSQSRSRSNTHIPNHEHDNSHEHGHSHGHGRSTSHGLPHAPVAPTLDYNATAGPSLETHNIIDPELAALYPETLPRPPPQGQPQPSVPDIYPASSLGYAVQSPETDASAEHATTRWLDLLATDAAQAGDGFRLTPLHDVQSLHDVPRTGFEPSPPAHLLSSRHPERYAWQEESDLALSRREARLFRVFTERIASWLDLFDPHKPFSNYATRLATRNLGLMKAILALSARYSALLTTTPSDPTKTTTPSKATGNEPSTTPIDPAESIQFYYETLHYVSTALQYTTYKHSEELLATAIVISTYEMLDASTHNSNWQRHLKGVFWIQRSQDVNGSSGGLRQAVWWAWLRQDIWAAFRERRRCFSFWGPVVDYQDLGHEDLALRAVYLLSQAVNFCAESRIDANSGNGNREGDADVEAARWRSERGAELMEMLERWRTFASSAFKTLPTESREGVHGWTPIWIHPPAFAVAMQVYSFAKILVCLHSPATSGFAEFRKIQKTLNDAIATICGIAMELTDPSCQIISAQCLFGAGLCVQDEVKQETIVSFIQACGARTGWPMATMLEDLRMEWRKAA
ncbi:hypothetical protein BJX68DRAFT_277418 [Aspergillus pseudodeflectus]|uniref:Zn(2)-C6 fungal-type domain-containing protein n=1 Tax=Aspergillus pseudodeflectus TaxID=176178 RepID=A0ABR4JYI0_9EURO